MKEVVQEDVDKMHMPRTSVRLSSFSWVLYLAGQRIAKQRM